MKRRDGSRRSIWDAEKEAHITNYACYGELAKIADGLYYMIRFHVRLYITNIFLSERHASCQRR
jgi:hypothetical protein